MSNSAFHRLQAGTRRITAMPPQAQPNTTRNRPPSWVQRMSSSTVTDPEYWPPRNPEFAFDWTKSTIDVYASTEEHSPLEFAPTFASARNMLDYNYHANLVERRQQLQDAILGRVMNQVSSSQKEAGAGAAAPDNSTQQANQRPWIVFTAGAMGVGKGYVLTQLAGSNLFPVADFVKIDPDMLKSELPEQAGYLSANKESAATKLHRESTQMADVLLEHSLANKFPVLVDGSLRDVDYYTQLFARIHKEFPLYRIAILHVTATHDVIVSRAEQRAVKTGRVVPHDLLEASMKQVPRSVAKLSHLADAVHVIANNEDQPLELVSSVVKGQQQQEDGHEKALDSWQEFANLWKRHDNHVASSDDSDGPVPTFDPTERSRISIPICNMLSVFDCSDSHAAANNIWSASYPNFCARCALTCDRQCGVCVHGIHLCSCTKCNGEPPSEACSN